ncbi:MAG: FHA domain-containing protein [Candidatus Woesearchaeota archaeon]
MTNIKKAGGYGSAGLLVIALAIFMFTKGMTIPGIAILLVGAFALLGFHEFIGPRMGKKKHDEIITPEEVIRRFEVIAGKSIDVEIGGQELVKEETRFVTAVRQVVDSAKKIVPKDTRKETFGEEIVVINEVRPEMEKRLLTLNAELEQSQRALEKVIDSLHKEQSEIGDKVKSMQHKKKTLSDLEKKLADEITTYKRVFTGIDSGGELSDKIAKLHKLEEQIDRQKKSETSQVIFQELNKAESDCNYLAHLKDRIEGTIRALRESIPEGTKDERYDTMMAKLDNMGKMIQSDLVPAAHEHRMMVDAIWKKLRRFDDIIITLKQSELDLLRVEHTSNASDAEARAIEAAKRINELEKQAGLVQGLIDSANRTASMNLARAKNAEEMIQRWEKDLEDARKAAKADPRLSTAFNNALVQNIGDQTATISGLVKIMIAQESHADACKELTETSKKKVEELNGMIAALDTQNRELQLAKETAEQQMIDLKGRITHLIKEQQHAQQEMAKAAEAETRAEYEERLRNLTNDMEDVQTMLAEASNSRTDLENELRIAKNHLTEARQQIEGKMPELAKVQEELDVTQEVLRNTKSLLSRITKERDEDRKEAEEIRDRLESHIATLTSSIKKREKKIQELKQEHKENKERSDNYANELQQELISYLHMEQDLDELREKLDSQITAAVEAGASNKEIEKRFSRQMEELQEQFKKQFEETESRHKKIQGQLTQQLAETNSINEQLAKDISEKAQLAVERGESIKELERLCEENRQAAKQAAEDSQIYIRDMLTPHIVQLKQEKDHLTLELEELKKTLDKTSSEDNDRLSRISSELNKTQATLKAREKDIISQQGIIKSERERIQENNKLLEKLKHEKEQAELEYRGSLEELEAQLKRSRKESDDSQSKVDELIGRIAELERKNFDIENNADIIEERLHQKLDEVKIMHARAEEAASEKAALNAEIARRQELHTQENARLRQEISEKEKTNVQQADMLKQKLASREQVYRQEIEGLNQEIRNKDEQNSKIAETFRQKLSEREDFYLQQTELLKEELENTLKMRDMAVQQEEESRRLIQELKSMNSAASEEKTVLEQRVVMLQSNLATAKDNHLKLHESIELLRQEVMQLKVQAHSNPILQKEITVLLHTIGHKETLLKETEEEVDSKQKEIDQAMRLVQSLEDEIRDVTARAEAQVSDLKTQEDNARRLARMVKINEVIREVMYTIDKARQVLASDPDEAKAFAEKAISRLEMEKRKGLTPTEIERVEHWQHRAQKMRDTLDERITQRQNLVAQRIERDRKGIGVLEPFTVNKYSTAVTQFYDKEGRSAEKFPGLLLDYRKKKILVGRKKSSASRMNLSSEHCDVIITGDMSVIRQISREHFELDKTAKGYILKSLGSNALSADLQPVMDYNIANKKGEWFTIQLSADGRWQVSLQGKEAAVRLKEIGVFTTGGKDMEIDVSKNVEHAQWDERLTFTGLTKNTLHLVGEGGKEYDTSIKVHTTKDPKGAYLILEAGMRILLEDGLRIFLDPERTFGFTFSRISFHDIGKVQRAEWYKAMVSFSENYGYLELPSHAKVKGSTGAGPVIEKDKELIVLNKVTTRIGNGKESDIHVKTSDNYRVILSQGAATFADPNEMIKDTHTILTEIDNEYFIENKARTGTFVNYLPVTKRQRLNEGDIIHLGENEQVFFRFGIKTFSTKNRSEWKQQEVFFTHSNFDCPPIKAKMGVLYFPKNVTAGIVNKIGSMKMPDLAKILLNKYEITFGTGEDNDVELIECDRNIKDKAGNSAADKLKGIKRLCKIRREFGSAYSITLYHDGKIIKVITKEGSELMLKDKKREGDKNKGETFLLSKWSLIRSFDNENIFGLFRVSEEDYTSDKKWKKVRMNIRADTRYETPDELEQRIDGKIIISPMHKLTRMLGIGK